MDNTLEPLLKLAKEYAPGIPAKDKQRAIPVVGKPSEWKYAIQEHTAKRAGKHYDLRLANGGVAYSWAIRHLPEIGETRLAVRQPDHTPEYMTWAGTIPSGYGAGTVKLLDSAKTEVLEAGPDKIRFNLYHKHAPKEYVLIRTDGDKWIIKNVTLTRKADGKEIPQDKPKYKETEIDETPEKYMSDKYLASAKLEGAHTLIHFGSRGPRIVSYRPTEREAGIIDHTYKMPDIAFQKVPKELKGTLLRAEVYATDKKGKALESQEVSGVLNSSVEQARKTQDEKGWKLRPAVFDIIRYRGKDVTHLPYKERFEIVKKLTSKLKGLEVPDTAHTASEKRTLISDIKRGKHPKTQEGVVFWNLEDPTAAPIKAKIRPDYDVYVREIFPAEGKYKDTHAGGFKYSLTPKGPVLGNCGTGFDDATRKDMWEHPKRYIGRVAKVLAQQQFDSGALRTPAFTGWHLEKGKQAEWVEPLIKLAEKAEGKLVIIGTPGHEFAFLRVAQRVPEKFFKDVSKEHELKAQHDFPHLTVFNKDEVQEIKERFGDEWKDAIGHGRTFTYDIDKPVVSAAGEKKKLWMIRATSPELKKHRESLGFEPLIPAQKTRKLMPFHITFASEKAADCSSDMLRAIADRLLQKEAGCDKPYRDRVEVWAFKDGKIFGGIYPDGSFGVCGGGIDAGETPERAGRREFLEECGYRVKKLHPAYIPSVKSRWSEEDKKRLAKKDPERATLYQGSRTFFYIADLGKWFQKPTDKTKLKDLRLYDIEEAVKLVTKTEGSQRLTDARVKILQNVMKLEQTARIP